MRSIILNYSCGLTEITEIIKHPTLISKSLEFIQQQLGHCSGTQLNVGAFSFQLFAVH